MDNYPPGVSGNEYAIAGEEFEEEFSLDAPCPNCGSKDGVLFGCEGRTQVNCYHCDLIIMDDATAIMVAREPDGDWEQSLQATMYGWNGREL